MKKIFFEIMTIVMVCGLVLTGCPDLVGGENIERIEITVLPTQPVSGDGENSNQTESTTLITQPISVKEALANATVSQFSTNAGYISMGYDKDLDSLILTYKVGLIENMFLQYLSNVVAAAPGRKFTYTEITGHSEYQQIQNMNTLINAGVNVFFSGAKASSAVAAVLLGFGTAASESVKVNAKANANGVNISFDLTSVTQSAYTETYTNWLQISNSIEQDMSVYEQGKEYALAAFADVGLYQVLKYDLKTRTATAIPGGSLYFNVESVPAWDIYEYSKDTEMEISKKLTVFQQTAITVQESDLFQNLTKSYTITKGSAYDFTADNSSGISEPFTPDLYAPILQCFGYDRVKFDVAFDYKAVLFLWIHWGGDMRLRIVNSDNTELNRKDFNTGGSWTKASHSATVSISSLKSPTCDFALLWSKTGTTDYSIGTRTITITAVK